MKSTGRDGSHKSMNILHLSPYFPSLRANHAGGVSMGKEIETLQQDHEVWVLSFLSQPFDRELYEDHKNDPHWQAVSISKWTRAWHILTEPWMPYYFAARTSLRLALRLISMVRKYQIDAIHAEYAAMGQYLWIKKLFPRLKFTLVEHDMTAQSYERKVAHSRGLKKAFMQWQLAKVLCKEEKYIRKADHVLVFNEKDRKLIEKYYGRADVQVINPFFDELGELSSFRAAENQENGRTPEQNGLKNHKDGMICFLGQMARPENHQAAMRLIRLFGEVEEKLQTDKSRDMTARPELFIVGNRPSEELKSKESESVHITGFVDDVDSYLRQAQLAVFPLEQGAGIKVKVLRAMAVGTAVITGDIGAEGIDENYEVLIHAESDEEYVSAIRKYLSGENDTAKIGAQCRQFVLEHFGWEKSEKVLYKLYHSI